MHGRFAGGWVRVDAGGMVGGGRESERFPTGPAGHGLSRPVHCLEGFAHSSSSRDPVFRARFTMGFKDRFKEIKVTPGNNGPGEFILSTLQPPSDELRAT